MEFGVKPRMRVIAIYSENDKKLDMYWGPIELLFWSK